MKRKLYLFLAYDHMITYKEVMTYMNDITCPYISSEFPMILQVSFLPHIN